MASTTSTTSQPDQPKKYNLRNPLPLSASQEAEVRDVYYKRVRGHCAAEIKGSLFLPSHLFRPVRIISNWYTAFAECAVNRTVTATWVCRSQRLAMNGCMISHATPSEEDRAREEWFATFQERKKARQEEGRNVEKRRGEVIQMMREDDARRAAQR